MSMEPAFAKVIEWSTADQCFIGSAPGLIYGGCHGSDERQVFDELCRIVDDVLQLYKADGKAIPIPATGLIEKIDAALRSDAAE
jgi:hypothetical protein